MCLPLWSDPAGVFSDYMSASSSQPLLPLLVRVRPPCILALHITVTSSYPWSIHTRGPCELFCYRLACRRFSSCLVAANPVKLDSGLILHTTQSFCRTYRIGLIQMPGHCNEDGVGIKRLYPCSGVYLCQSILVICPVPISS